MANHRKGAFFGLFLCSWLAIGSIAIAQTAAPLLRSVVQSGGQRGTTIQVTLSGVNMGYGIQALFEGSGLTVETVKPDPVPPKDAKNPEGKLNVTVRIAPDAALGIRAVRVVTPLGISDVGHVVIGQWPEVGEKEPNNNRAQAQALTGPVTVIGHSDGGEDVDCYRVTISQGESFVFEAQAGVLGSPMEPVLTLEDAQGHEVGFGDALTRANATLLFTAPRSGDYFLFVRDLSYRGSGEYLYRLTVGKIPYVTGVFPLGGTAGTTASLTLAGVNLPAPAISRFPIPAESPEASLTGLFAAALPLSTDLSNVVRLAVGTAPEIMAAGGTDTPARAQQITPPVTINGRLTAYSTGKSAANHFRFHADKGQMWELETIANRIGSPLDTVLTVLNANGQELASNDDARGKDSFLTFTAPETGDYLARVTDLNGRSGMNFTYRLRIAPALPDFSLDFAPDCPVVAPGDRVPFIIRATRKYGYDGEIALDISGLPPAIHVVGPLLIPKGQTQTTLLLTADAGANVAVFPLRLTGTGIIGGKRVTYRAQSLAVSYVKNGDQIERVTKPVPMPFVVISDAPDLIVTTNSDPVSLPVGKTTELLVKVTRKAGFTAKIPLDVRGLPSGVTVANLEMPEKQSEVKLTLKAEGNAVPGETSLLILGRSVVDELHFTEHAALPVRLIVTK